MRRVRYSVAMSLDGYIAGPKGEADWIVMDPDFDFSALYKEFDTVLLGRRTFEPMAATMGTMPGMRTIVFSRTLKPSEYPEIEIATDAPRTVAELKSRSGKDLWLFGGGSLFRNLAEAGLVDTVEVGVVPVLLGAGIPLLPPPTQRIQLTLANHKVYKTGTISLEYRIVQQKR